MKNILTIILLLASFHGVSCMDKQFLYTDDLNYKIDSPVFVPSPQDKLRDFLYEETRGSIHAPTVPVYRPPVEHIERPPLSSDDNESVSHRIGRHATKIRKGASNILFGKEQEVKPRVADIADHHLESFKNSDNEEDRQRYRSQMYKDPAVRRDVDNHFHPFSKIIFDSGRASEYRNPNFKSFLFEVRDDADKINTMLELASKCPNILIDKDISRKRYHEMLEDYKYTRDNVFPTYKYQEPTEIIYDHDSKLADMISKDLENITLPGGILDVNFTPHAAEGSLGTPNTSSLHNIDDIAVDREITNTYLLDTVLTHANKERLNTPTANWNKDLKDIDRVLSNASHITEEMVKDFDPVTRGVLLGVADVAQDKYALAVLMSPAGKGIIGGSFGVAKEIAVGTGEKVSYVSRVTEMLSDDNFNRHLASRITKSNEEFSEFMGSENLKTKKVLNPSGLTTDDIKKLGLSKSAENVIRYSVREYLNAKIHPGYTGTIKKNLKKSVTYARAYGQISSGKVPSANVRLGKGLIRNVNDAIIRNSGSGDLARIAGQTRAVKDIVDTAHAAGFLPSASDYDD